MGEPILLVDDEPGIRRVLTVALGDLGYEIFTADSGETALELFKTHCPRLVISDIKMPGMDGIGLLRAIKTEAPDTEVIMITGHGDMDLAIESLKLDAADFITKPIRTDALEIALQRALEKIDLRKKVKDYTGNLERMVQQTSSRLIEAERQLAAGQVVEGLFGMMQGFSRDLTKDFSNLDRFPCFAAVHSRELKIVAVNDFFTRHVGDRVGARSWEIYQREESESDYCPAGETFRLGTYRRSVESMRLNGDQTLTVAVYSLPIRDQNGKVDLVLELASDIADLSNLHQELHSIQQRYRRLFDEVPCYIAIHDSALRLVEINRRFKNTFGEQIGKHCFAVYKNRQRPCTDCPVVKSFADGQTHEHDTVLTSSSGEQIDVLLTTAPIRDAAGQIEYVMSVATDISTLRSLQSHLESLGLMIGTVSHNIKGLLTGLEGGLYILDSAIEKKNSGEVVEGRDIIRQMSRRIKSMILDILYYAKERRLITDTIDVAEFVEDVAQTVRHRASESGVAFDIHTDETCGEIRIDAGAVQSALHNMLENAIDACLDLTPPTTGRIALTAQGSKTDVVFEISDNGIGMDSETCNKVFELFFSTKGNRGTGLGLFISQKIIQQHGGSITVSSAIGKGTRFTILIPRDGSGTRTRSD